MKTYIIIILCFFNSSACNISKNDKPKSGYDVNKLEGRWELEYIISPTTPFEKLYVTNKPFIEFNVTNKKISGINSCNHFGGELVIQDSSIDLSGPIAVTEMYCPDQAEGEMFFNNVLSKVNSWKVTDSLLFFMSRDSILMRFVKKPKA